MKPRRLFAICALALLCTTVRPPVASAQWTVFDPTNYANALLRLEELRRQYTQLVNTYAQVRNQYILLTRWNQIVPVPMSTRYRVPALPWRLATGTSVYGTSEGWLTGLNTGDPSGTGYRRATQPLDEYGGALGGLPADEAARIRTSYATAELTDAAIIGAIDAIGGVRTNALRLQEVLSDLEQDSLSSDPSMNTLIGVLNKINAANVVSLRATQATNQILTSLLEERLVDAKRRRDADVAGINDHIAFASQARDLYRRTTARTTEVLTSFRLP